MLAALSGKLQLPVNQATIIQDVNCIITDFSSNNFFQVNLDCVFLCKEVVDMLPNGPVPSCM